MTSENGLPSHTVSDSTIPHASVSSQMVNQYGLAQADQHVPSHQSPISLSALPNTSQRYINPSISQAMVSQQDTPLSQQHHAISGYGHPSLPIPPHHSHAQPISDIPIEIYNQTTRQEQIGAPTSNFQPSGPQESFFLPYNPAASPPAHDVPVQHFYGNVPVSHAERGQLPTTQFNTTAPEAVNGPKDLTSTAPVKRKRGRPALFPTADNDLGRGVEEEEHTLYGAIRSGRVPPQTLVDDWIEQYKTNRAPAMLELVQFFISCSGCKGKVSPEMYSSLPHADIIKRMTEEFEEDSGEYPLVQTSPLWRRFRVNFVEFIQVLVRQCQYSIIYDQCMVEQLVSLLTGLSDSPVRAFRHTSTLAAMKMMTALVDVALNVSINRDNTQRQYEGERARGQARRASERLEVLMQRRQELEENMKEVKDMLILLFKGVFVHRYRDSQPEIRAICIQEIGVWMRRYPAMFLDDSYLKYVGWTLYDRVGDVRLQCLRALQPLYEDQTLVTNMQLFTSRFKSRLVDMTLDKELEVAVQAVKLVSCILKYNETVLENKDCENIYELVYCTHRPLAQAAGEFLTLKLFEVDANALVTRTKKGKKRSENTPLIRDLVQFFIESELHEHAAYLVDSLWEIAPMLRDWEAMIDLLIEEPGKNEEPLDSTQENSLIEIMVCCVKQAATGESPVGRQGGVHHTPVLGAGGAEVTTVQRGSRSGVMTAREAKALAEARSRMTEAMIPAMHPLLTRFGESAERAATLLQIPRYMDLEIYTSGRHQRHLDLLLQCVEKIVERHTDPETLLACSRVYEVLCMDELSIAANCQTVRNTLLDRLTELYRRAFLNYFAEQAAPPDEDDEFHLVAALKRLYAFFSFHDLNGLDLWESLIRIIRSTEAASPEIIGLAIACCSKALLWRLVRVSEPDPNKEEITELRQMLDAYMPLCVELVVSDSKRIATEAYLSLCDLLVAFSRHLSVTAPNLQSLVYHPNQTIESGLIRFLESFVFVDDEEDENAKFEALHQRRIHLAAFCKLVVYNLLPIRSAAPLYKHYIRFYSDFGDILKSTLGKMREINRVHTAKMIALCLQLGFTELQESCSDENLDRGSDGFQALRELSRRLNLSFGLDLIKIREAVVAFHSEGLQFCLASTPAPTSQDSTPPVPQNLLFLEIVAEFSNKLLRQDKQSISEYTYRLFPGASGEEWASLQAYRTSLDPDSADHMVGGAGGGANQHSASSALAPSASGSLAPTGTGRGRGGASGGGGGRGRPRRPRESDSSASGIDFSAPQFASTAVKRRKGDGGNPSGGTSQQPYSRLDGPSPAPARRPGRPPGSGKRQNPVPSVLPPPLPQPVGHVNQ